MKQIAFFCPHNNYWLNGRTLYQKFFDWGCSYIIIFLSSPTGKLECVPYMFYNFWLFLKTYSNLASSPSICTQPSVRGLHYSIDIEESIKFPFACMIPAFVANWLKLTLVPPYSLNWDFSITSMVYWLISNGKQRLLITFLSTWPNHEHYRQLFGTGIYQNTSQQLWELLDTIYQLKKQIMRD